MKGDNLRGASSEGDDDIHFVFSTDCKPYQNWQVVALLKSAEAVGQKGVFTRVVSGCERGGKPWIDQAKKLLKIKNVRLHFTPGYDNMYGDAYPPYNRPFGLAHWALYAYPPITQKTIVIIDPDMMFLKPFLNGAPQESLSTSVAPFRLKDIGLTDGKPSEKVIKGRPVGAFYGIGSKFLSYPEPYQLSYFCSRTEEELAGVEVGSERHQTMMRLEKECNALTDQDGGDYFNVGPPYMLHLDDFTEMLPFWRNFTRDARKAVPELIAEMYGYSLAAAHLGLKHVRLNNLMLSDTRPGSYGEDWDKLGYETDPCKDGKPVTLTDEPNLPNWMHMAQRYAWNFHKRHVPWDILECDAKMLPTPPKDMFEKSSTVGAMSTCQFNNQGNGPGASPPQVQKTCEKRAAWVTCMLIPMINNGLEDYKREFCPAGYNEDKETYVLAAPHQAYGRPNDACESCTKKFDGGAYAESSRVH